jgi:hypothetical protein
MFSFGSRREPVAGKWESDARVAKSILSKTSETVWDLRFLEMGKYD